MDEARNSRIITFLLSRRGGAVLIALFFLSHLAGLTRYGAWIDELHTYGAARLTWRELVAERAGAGHLPAYFLVVKAWCERVGYSEATMRLPSLVFATSAFAAFLVFCQRFVSDLRIRLLAMAICFAQPNLFYLAHEARMYSALVFCSILCAYLCLSYLESGRWPWLVGYALAAVAGMQLHILFGAQLAAHLVFAAMHHRSRLGPVFVAAALALAGVAPLLWAYHSRVKEYRPTLMLAGLKLSPAMKGLGTLTTGDFRRFLPAPWRANPFVWTSWGLFVIFAALTVRRYRTLAGRLRLASAVGESSLPAVGREARLLLFCLYWIAVPVVLMHLSPFLGNDHLGMVRYYQPLLGAVILLTATGLATLPGSWWGWTLRTAFVVLFVFGLIVQGVARGPGIREALAFLKRDYREGDGVLYCHSGALREAFAFFGADSMERRGLDRDVSNPDEILEVLTGFGQGRSRLWILLHRERQSPVREVMERNGDLFELFVVEHPYNTEVRGYRLHPRIPSRDETAYSHDASQ